MKEKKIEVEHTKKRREKKDVDINCCSTCQNEKVFQ